ncbi:hypothetical protein OB69_16420 [Roseivirga seohaensis subsp. aquiponti]|uniref:HTH araC/xylS-type domain-containing protein n=1 Tax=Roseivirga seohaensis subsp. aquiponti TaxID=1566026 RepID=A0A0L8AH74_9BACT|nr:helix-turn-helix domain-containing protein [Roseivirga seohaensis]KOF01626.1 hypothetical protein OB69_16420 [Roseivirga seohaensis subsp. aquiponti]
MKVLPFKIPKTEASSLYLQTDDEQYFYDMLHQHPEIQITWIISGEGTLIHGDHLRSFKGGQIFVMGSNVPHVFRCDKKYYEQGMRVLSKSIFFRAEHLRETSKLFPEIRELLQFIQNAERGIRVKDDFSPQMLNAFEKVFETNGLRRLNSFFELLHLFGNEESIAYLNELPQKSVKEAEGRRLDDIFRFTLENFGRRITLEEVAEVANMNKASFCRYFKQHTRKTYIDFLNDYRIGQACKLLLNKDNTVSQVCYESGFSNLSNFNRKFKEVTGKTPREYRGS